MKYILVNPGGKYDDKKNYNFCMICSLYTIVDS